MRNISAGIGGQVGHLMVNGPAGDALCWDAIDWRGHEDKVRRLRQRVFTAARGGGPGTLRKPQKVMVRGWGKTVFWVGEGAPRKAGGKNARGGGGGGLPPP